MDTLKIGFCDHYELMDEYFIQLLSERYNIVRDDDKPDYLFYSCFGMRHYKGQYDNAIKIAVLHENVRPWSPGFGDANFTIGYDRIENNPKYYRLPLYVVDYWNMHTKMGLHDWSIAIPVESKTKFCGFIVGNGNCAKRNQFFDLLSQYKTVDSAGPLFNNTGFILPRGANAPAEKLEFLKPYKFNMCFENDSYPGYITEKLFHALYMNTVPIYWGDPEAHKDFNKRAFLSWHDYGDDHAFLEAIKKVDNDPELYEDMIRQPMIDDTSIMNTHDFLDWFNHAVVEKK